MGAVLLVLTRLEAVARQWGPSRARALTEVVARVLMTACCARALQLRLAQKPDLESRLVVVLRVVPVDTKYTMATAKQQQRNISVAGQNDAPLSLASSWLAEVHPVKLLWQHVSQDILHSFGNPSRTQGGKSSLLVP